VTVTRVRYGAVDAYGDPSDADPDRAVIAGAFTAPRTSGDVNDRGRLGVVVGLDLFTPHGSDVTATDGIDVDGVVYRIVGDVTPWVDPLTGRGVGQTCALERGQG
jgi:hypothetical protein